MRRHPGSEQPELVDGGTGSRSDMIESESSLDVLAPQRMSERRGLAQRKYVEEWLLHYASMSSAMTI